MATSPSNVSPSASNIAAATNIPRDLVLPNFSPAIASNAAPQTVNTVIPPAWDFWDLRLLLTNCTLAMISEIRILINAVPRLRWAPSANSAIGGGNLVDLINQYDGLSAYGSGTSGVLMIPLRRLLITGGAQSLGAPPQGSQTPILYSGSSKDLALLSTLNTGSTDQNGNGIGTVTMEIVLINTGSSAPTIQLRATASAPTAGGSGLVPSFESTTAQVGGGSQFNFANAYIKFGDNKHLLLNRLFFVPASGTMDDWLIRWNGNQVLQRTSAENDLIQETGQHVPQDGSGMYTIDYSERGWGDEMLPIGAVGTDLQVDVTPSAAGQMLIGQHGLGTL